MRRIGRCSVAVRRILGSALGVGLLLTLASPAPTIAAADDAATAARTAQDGRDSGCRLDARDGRITHVVNIMFDNVHFTRDNPNVPSDLEQMPNLLNFITSNGTMLDNEHTGLISHTGSNILTSLTGLYGDLNGQPVSNGFGFYDTNQTASFRSTFQYWTARLGGKNDNSYYMTTAGGKNTPAPWVPYTRAGCSYGAIASANTVLENTRFDIPTVFGPGSPEAQEQQQNNTKAQADFVGIAIHCGRDDQHCATATGSRPDLLPDEPGGYQGFQGLFGARYADPLISPGGPLTDLNGGVIKDGSGNPGFPGFDAMSTANSLSWVAAMQEHGVPVTAAYISDAHDNHAAGRAYGPGEAGYVSALKQYDQDFAAFFQRLAKAGITKDNTLFTFTSDENDHFVGGPPADPKCDGVTRPCTYPKIGELDGNLSGMLSTVPPYSTGTPVPGMSVHSDSAPTVYLEGNPGQTDSVTRTVERAAGHIQAVNPITGETDHVTNYLAGVAEMRNLHMITSDSARNPTLTVFANPNYYLCATGFSCPMTGNQIVEDPRFAWNHGTLSPDITTTWLGLVGPGVRHLGVNESVWSDHADDRPTTLYLVGLKDDYRHQGRVLVETLTDRAAGDAARYQQLGRVYKQLNATIGQFGLATIQASTRAMESGTAQDDTVYTSTTRELVLLGQQRDRVAAEMASILDQPVSTVSGGNDHDSQGLVEQGLATVKKAWLLAGE